MSNPIPPPVITYNQHTTTLTDIYTTVLNIFLWNNKITSLIVLISSILILYLTIVQQYTLITLLFSTLSLQLLLCLLYNNTIKLINKQHAVTTNIEKQYITVQSIQPYIELICELINTTIHYIISLYTCQSNIHTIQYIILCTILSIIGRYIDGMILLCIILVILFTIPKLYITYQTTIDKQLNQLNSNFCQLVNLIMLQTSNK